MLALLVLIVIVIAVFLIFKKPAVKSGVIPVSSPAGQGQTGSNKSSAGNLNDVTTKGDSPGSSAPTPSGSPGQTSGLTLQAPSGTFVSNHRPSLSGANGVPSSELSICTTTAGANCYLKFTKDGVVKTLPVQTTDGSGSTSWRWDVSTAGFTVGTWQVTAIATLGNQTKSTPDGFPFEVQP